MRGKGRKPPNILPRNFVYTVIYWVSKVLISGVGVDEGGRTSNFLPNPLPTSQSVGITDDETSKDLN